MKRVGPIILLITTLAITAVMNYLYAENSRRYAFGWEWTAADIFLALPLIFVIATVVWLLRALPEFRSSLPERYRARAEGRAIPDNCWRPSGY